MTKLRNVQVYIDPLELSNGRNENSMKEIEENRPKKRLVELIEKIAMDSMLNYASNSSGSSGSSNSGGTGSSIDDGYVHGSSGSSGSSSSSSSSSSTGSSSNIEIVSSSIDYDSRHDYIEKQKERRIQFKYLLSPVEVISDGNHDCPWITGNYDNY